MGTSDCKSSLPLLTSIIVHNFAKNSETSYIAYVSEQNLLLDESGQPVSHPQVGYLFFDEIENGHYTVRHTQAKYLI